MSRRERVRDDGAEPDRIYFWRRSDQERRAARNATGMKARNAHAKLAELFAGLARRAETLAATTQH